ncbi:MAG: MBL fold metallo-hydrolase [Clostridia bacterium]
MKICALSSGSKGNCTYIENENIAIIVDNGLTLKDFLARVEKANIDINKIKGILVTHEHIDHIKGVGMLSRKLDIPIYAHTQIWDFLKCKLGKLDDCNCKQITEEAFEIEDIGVQPFRVPHDAIYTLGYSLSCDSQKVSVATDLGIANKGIINNLKGSQKVLLEANHDVQMLKNGSYPQYLINRILGNNGHLSNDNCSKVAVELATYGMEKLILGHLSMENNSPEVAFDTVATEFKRNNIVEGKQVDLLVASQIKATSLI